MSTAKEASLGRRAFRRSELVARAVVWVAAVGLWATAVNVRAQTPTGQQDYQHYCAICHGPKGKGNGEASYSLSGTNPPDLTQLSKRNGGKFPFEDVSAIVDGRTDFPSHERLNMPFFGTNIEMEEEQTPQGKAKADARITAIVRYIETIQQK
ncbi:MAG: c-type cytochrome [Candidatus Binataceae bacterium]